MSRMVTVDELLTLKDRNGEYCPDYFIRLIRRTPLVTVNLYEDKFTWAGLEQNIRAVFEYQFDEGYDELLDEGEDRFDLLDFE